MRRIVVYAIRERDQIIEYETDKKDERTKR